MIGRKRQSKLEEMEAKLGELESQIRTNIAEREKLARKGKELSAALETTNPRERPGIREEIRDIEQEYAALKRKYDSLGTEISRLTPAVVAMRRRVRNAQHVLDVIENPPPWGLGDYNSHQLKEFEKRARQTIKELL